MAHIPERARLKFKPDQEEHHHDAEFGNMLQFCGFMAADKAKHRPDQHPGQQIAKHRAKPEPRRQGHGNHGCCKIDRGLEKEGFHQPFGIRSTTSRPLFL